MSFDDVDDTTARAEGPRGLARYRNPTLVTAGGLACAAVGAVLGGLGGSVAVDPVAGHSVASSTAPEQAVAAAIESAADVDDAVPVARPAVAEITSVSSEDGAATRRSASLSWLTLGGGTQRGASSSVRPGDAAGAASVQGTGTGTGAGSGTDTGTIGAGLGRFVDSVTTLAGRVGTVVVTQTTAPVGHVIPSLQGVLSELAATLADLGSLVPAAPLPEGPGGVLAAGLPGSGAVGGAPSSVPGGVAALLDAVTATAAAASSSLPAVPAIPPGTSASGSALPTVPSLPAPTAPTGPASPPSGGATVSTGTNGGPATTTTTTTTTTPAGTTVTATVTTPTTPLPAPPVPSIPPVSVGGVSVGVNTSGSSTGLTLTLP
jgi:DNA segregation ATPase FtsK/SpoIIIE, S-DNA-T family